MSTKQAVTIACRVLSVYFLTWLLTDLTYLPSNLYSFCITKAQWERCRLPTGAILISSRYYFVCFA